MDFELVVDAAGTPTSTDVTPPLSLLDIDPVQRGWMCAGGTGCTSGRRPLGSTDVNVTKDGRVVVGYADECVGACALPGGTREQSASAYATVACQSAGKGLFAAFDS